MCFDTQAINSNGGRCKEGRLKHLRNSVLETALLRPQRRPLLRRKPHHKQFNWQHHGETDRHFDHVTGGPFWQVREAWLCNFKCKFLTTKALCISAINY